MNTTKQIRLQQDIFEGLQEASGETPISELLREEMKRYVSGVKQLEIPVEEPPHRTSMYLDHTIVEGVVALAKTNGVSFDAAVNIMAERLVRELKESR